MSEKKVEEQNVGGRAGRVLVCIKRRAMEEARRK